MACLWQGKPAQSRALSADIDGASQLRGARVMVQKLDEAV
jgi:hypothetical protein